MLSKWDIRFLELAGHIGNWSKDQSTKVGAVIVDDDRRIVSVGYNGFPAGVDDDVDARHTRPIKYEFTEHAERNAIFSAARLAVSVKDCVIYCNYFPCSGCARAIIQAGIKRVVYAHRAVNSAGSDDSLDPVSVEMFQEARVRAIQATLLKPNNHE